MTNTTNVRHLPLVEAEYEICENLRCTFLLGGSKLDVIHGYNYGTAIRNFVRNPNGLRSKLRKHYPELPNVEIINQQPGMTSVYLKEDN